MTDPLRLSQWNWEIRVQKYFISLSLLKSLDKLSFSVVYRDPHELFTDDKNYFVIDLG